ncbi:hypothetical protein CRUP_021310 [Coryphaenoides rupestris]|nr:hypothetical protein CRUP_021310 [Coryphaenoides rupestris]
MHSCITINSNFSPTFYTGQSNAKLWNFDFGKCYCTFRVLGFNIKSWSFDINCRAFDADFWYFDINTRHVHSVGCDAACDGGNCAAIAACAAVPLSAYIHSLCKVF